jgi:hypothetical protein
MLEVGPWRFAVPNPDSLTVLTAKTLLLLASKAITVFLVGEIAINPGELPPVSGGRPGRVSFSPLMITSPPNVVVEVTPCEARTRSGRPLVCLAGDDPPPQEIRLRPTHKPATTTRMRLFKPLAPNHMKKEDCMRNREL